MPVKDPVGLKTVFAGLAATLFFYVQVQSNAQQRNAEATTHPPATSQRQFLDRFCAACHNEQLKNGGLNLVHVDLSAPGKQPELWEKVVRKLHTGVMPPPNMPQPSDADRRAMVTWLETSLDAASAIKLNCAYRKSHPGPEPARSDSCQSQVRGHGSLKHQQAREIGAGDWRAETKSGPVGRRKSAHLTVDRNCLEERGVQAARRS